MDNNEIAQCNITEDEQSELLELNSEYQNLVLSLGELQVKEITLKKELKLVKETNIQYKETLAQFKQKEKMFFERLNKKYGEGTLDITTGVYIKS